MLFLYTKCAGTGSVQSVSMRDIGTEMTPIASQEQSMAGTPAGPATPTFSPLSSIPSTPKRGAPSSSSSEATVDSRLWVQKKLRIVQTPDRELQIRTRQEIAALGLKLGKFNIATWASKEEFPEESECDNNFDEGESAKRLFDARAAVWEESQKSKLVSRFFFSFSFLFQLFLYICFNFLVLCICLYDWMLFKTTSGLELFSKDFNIRYILKMEKLVWI